LAVTDDDGSDYLSVLNVDYDRTASLILVLVTFYLSHCYSIAWDKL